MTLIVVECNALATVQDLGRPGYARFGVPASGAMDPLALCAANLLVGNQENDAGIEIGLGDLTLRAAADCVAALTGAGYDLFVEGNPRPRWMATLIRRGWTAQVRPNGLGRWAYLGE